MAEVETGAGSVWSRAAGAGESVLLIAGLGEAGEAWDAQVSGLRSRRRVITYDARGLGQATTPPGPYSVEDLAADAVAVLDAHGLGAADIVGSSLGAVVAQRLALDHPERVRSLVLSGSWARPSRHLTTLLESWIVLAERAVSFLELVTAVNLWAFSPAAWEAGLVAPRLAAANAVDRVAFDVIRRGFIWSAEAALGHDSAGELEAIAAPALVTVGAEDRVTPPELGAAVAAGIPGAELVPIPGAGHQAFQERPEAFTRALDSFWAALPDRAPVGRP